MLTHSFMFWIEKLFECKKYLICNFMKDKRDSSIKNTERFVKSFSITYSHFFLNAFYFFDIFFS